MHDSLLVRRSQPLGDLRAQPHHFRGGQRPLRQLDVERDARDVLGDQEVDAIFAAEFVYGRDVGMIQARE